MQLCDKIIQYEQICPNYDVMQDIHSPESSTVYLENKLGLAGV